MDLVALLLIVVILIWRVIQLSLMDDNKEKK